MKYVKQTSIVEAEKYVKGMEDDYLCVSSFACDENISYKCEDCQCALPYINCKVRICLIEDGDYIVTDSNGNKYPVDSDTFETTYKVVE